MAPAEIVSQEKALDGLFNAVANLEDPELQAHFARYLCIKIASYLEVSITAIFGACAEAKSSAEIARYVKLSLKKEKNRGMTAIINLADSFSSEISGKVRDASNGQISDSVSSIIRNRNSIAHGTETDVTVLRLKPWFDDAKKLVAILQDSCR